MSDQVEAATPLPTIDISPFLRSNASESSRSDVILTLRQACLEHGFFVATGHGIPPSLQRDVLSKAREFFSLSTEEKMSLIETKSFGKSHRGYQAIKGERLQYGKAADLKEGFQMGVEKAIDHPDCEAQRMLTGPNVWPQPLEPDFSDTMKDYFQRVRLLQDTIMQMLAQSLGIEYDTTFGAFSSDSLRGLRLLHYPPQQHETDLGAGAHTDFGALTVLLTDGVSGLQVLDRSGTWINVKTEPGAYVVNLGDMMQRMTSGLYKSSVHRVINTSGLHRYSAPMFLDGNLDFVIEPVVEGPSPPANRLTVEEHMMERFGTARDRIETAVSTGA